MPHLFAQRSPPCRLGVKITNDDFVIASPRLLTCLQDKRGSKVKTVPVTPNMDQTTSRPMPVATTLPAARDVQAMQQRRRLEGGGNSIENSPTFYFGMRFHSGSVCQGNIFSRMGSLIVERVFSCSSSLHLMFPMLGMCDFSSLALSDPEDVDFCTE